MSEYLIAFDGGGTRTRAGLYGPDGCIESLEGPASNPIEVGVYRSAWVLSSLAEELIEKAGVTPAVVAAGIAGLGKVDDLSPYLDRLFLPGVERLILSNDLSPVAAANLGAGRGVLVIAGTGSSVVVQDGTGAWRVFGGRGRLFGEAGSGYALGVTALQAAGFLMDGVCESTSLLSVTLDATATGDIDALSRWAAEATKGEIAALAKRVLEEAEAKDSVAVRCVEEEAEQLAMLTADAVEQMNLSSDAPILFCGGLVEGSAYYRKALTANLRDQLPEFTSELAPLRGTDAVARLARMEPVPLGVHVFTEASRPVKRPTERRPEDDIALDTLSAKAIAERMSSADRRAADAVAERAEDVARAITLAATAFVQGGRLIYVGAGTSGRLGVLDASECPPTFGVAPERVIGIMAGGDEALRTSIEGVEDDEAQARKDLDNLQPALSDRDVVVGIAASGTTPYVLAALEHGSSKGARTVLLCCNTASRKTADVVIDLDTGPEMLPGSTRLKAGTATKLVLNQISTGAMALSGHVYDGYMVGVRPVNRKLRIRCIQIVKALTNLEPSAAESLLDKADGDIRLAVLMHRKNETRTLGQERLERNGGNLRAALDD